MICAAYVVDGAGSGSVLLAVGKGSNVSEVWGGLLSEGFSVELAVSDVVVVAILVNTLPLPVRDVTELDNVAAVVSFKDDAPASAELGSDRFHCVQRGHFKMTTAISLPRRLTR